ncbi:TIGR00303 family protein [Sulfolobus sp. E5-1-F]|uniref:nicotinate mononucleotide-dependent phosphoribosyltransferase CobT n=1 Tax=Sulfolobaceae TaxID=118883 RepID=UPI001296A76C|nr:MULTISPECIES: TIGR00303 family protein [unclassified Sulfolobus]QGA53383.1 TIGR00303 family protein [Sulfolobus sp. E5-1-F]QGA68488.1 TIGR00303 family protein [Sulfolobus sp. E11-6]
MIKEYYGAETSILNKDFAYILVIGTTDVSLIPGLTIAGATPELTHFTPAADAEYVLLGKCKSINSIPVSPTGIPTPALLTRASLSFINPLKIVVNAGSRILPKIPYIDLQGEPGKDIRKQALSIEKVNTIVENGIKLGEELSNEYELIMIGESIPAGTTTAMASLLALGYDAMDKVSSASPDNPKELKRKVVEEALRNLPTDPLQRLAKVSDPVLFGVAGISLGFRGKILLAGGTQMTAAAAIVKEFNKNKVKDITIGTTKWIVEDKSADMLGLAKQVGVKVLVSILDLSISAYEGIRAYEKGYVKEGVGAGGSTIMAFARGVSNNTLVRKIDELYSELVGGNNSHI